MPIRRGPRNNVLAGVFLLASLSLAVAIIFILSNIWDRLTVPTNRYHVLFSLLEGAEGLDKGAYVKIGGERVGRVVGWEFTRDGAKVPVGIDVEVEMRADIRLYEDAVPQLVMPLLGSNSTINFPYLGDGSGVTSPQHGDPVLQPGETLHGELAAPAFLAQAGYGPKQKQQVQKMIEDAQTVVARIDKVTARIDKEVDPTIDQVKGIITDVKGIAGDAREHWKDWQQQVASFLNEIQDAGKTLSAAMEDARGGVKDARSAITSVQSAIDENRPKVDSTLTDIQDLAHKLDTDSYGAFKDVLDKGQRAMDQVVESAERLNTLIERRSPDLDQIIANGRLASDQLKLATIEVRAAPWKLLSKPTGRKELENEVLYDSVRAYATAASDLRAAAASLESVSASRAGAGPPDPIERRSVEEVTKALSEAFERYQKAEQDFLKRWSQSK